MSNIKFQISDITKFIQYLSYWKFPNYVTALGQEAVDFATNDQTWANANLTVNTKLAILTWYNKIYIANNGSTLYHNAEFILLCFVEACDSGLKYATDEAGNHCRYYHTRDNYCYGTVQKVGFFHYCTAHCLRETFGDKITIPMQVFFRG